MARLHPGIVVAVFLLINTHETATPAFLQAITSALMNIPLTGGPMTTGLVGAKLAIGSKLLYYLGFFGRRRSNPKPQTAQKSNLKLAGAEKGFFPGGMTALPLPYAMSGAAGFQQGFGGTNNIEQGPFAGFNAAQLFQILAAQGVDPITAMQVINSQGGSAGANVASFSFPSGGSNQGSSGISGGGGFGNMFQSGFGNLPGNGNGGLGNMPAGGGFENLPHDVSNILPPSDLDPGQDEGSESDIESFFTFLRDMDDNTCISRLVCDIGANPSFLGEFSENIHGIISSLDVKPSSGAFQYIAIMETGKREGECAGKFPQCGDTAYEIVKNVAPTVGIPDNINSAVVNKL